MPVASPAGDAPESLSSLDDLDALMAAQGQQVFAVAGDDEIGVRGDRGGDDPIVIGILSCPRVRKPSANFRDADFFGNLGIACSVSS